MVSAKCSYPQRYFSSSNAPQFKFASIICSHSVIDTAQPAFITSSFWLIMGRQREAKQPWLYSWSREHKWHKQLDIKKCQSFADEQNALTSYIMQYTGGECPHRQQETHSNRSLTSEAWRLGLFRWHLGFLPFLGCHCWLSFCEKTFLHHICGSFLCAGHWETLYRYHCLCVCVF